MKKHIKFSILHFALAASVSLLLVLAAPAGADFFAQVLFTPQSQTYVANSCPLPNMTCGVLNFQCVSREECEAASGATPFGTQPDVGNSCPLPNMTCGALNFQCVSRETCEAASGATPFGTTPQTSGSSGSCSSGKFKCASLNNQCATDEECYAADNGCSPGQIMCNALNKCATTTECSAADQSKTSTTTTTTTTTPKFTTTTQTTTNQTTTTPKFTTGTQTTTDKTTTTPKFTTPFDTDDTSTPKFITPFTDTDQPTTNQLTDIYQSTAKMKQPSTTNQITTETKQPATTDKLTKGDQAKTKIQGKSKNLGQPTDKSPGSQQTGKIAPGKVGTKDDDNEIFNVSTFGDKEIKVPKLPSSVNLDATDHTKNLKALNSLVAKTTKLKSNEEAMGKILLISQSLSDICEDANLKCSGREKLINLIDDASDGLNSKNMKKIKKAFESFSKSVKKEYAKSQGSSAKKANTKKSSTKK